MDWEGGRFVFVFVFVFVFLVFVVCVLVVAGWVMRGNKYSRHFHFHFNNQKRVPHSQSYPIYHEVVSTPVLLPRGIISMVSVQRATNTKQPSQLTSSSPGNTLHYRLWPLLDCSQSIKCRSRCAYQSGSNFGW